MSVIFFSDTDSTLRTSNPRNSRETNYGPEKKLPASAEIARVQEVKPQMKLGLVHKGVDS